MNLEKWVKDEIKKHDWVLNHDINISTRKLGSVARFGEMILSGQMESIDEWNIINTIGDGSCLVHSFLNLLSSSYDHISDDKKSLLATNLRTYLSIHMENLTDNEREELDSDVWLNDMIAEKIARYFGYGLVVLRVMNRNGVSVPIINSTDYNGLKYLIILNTGGRIDRNGEIPDSGAHFEAVYRNNKTVSPRQLGIDIEVKKNQLLVQAIEDNIRLEDRKRCDSPRQRTSIPESISRKEAVNMAKLFEAYEKGDNKERLCRKLSNLNQVDWYHKSKKMGIRYKSNSRRKQSNRLKRRKRSLSK